MKAEEEERKLEEEKKAREIRKRAEGKEAAERAQLIKEILQLRMQAAGN